MYGFATPDNTADCVALMVAPSPVLPLSPAHRPGLLLDPVVYGLLRPSLALKIFCCPACVIAM